MPKRNPSVATESMQPKFFPFSELENITDDKKTLMVFMPVSYSKREYRKILRKNKLRCETCYYHRGDLRLPQYELHIISYKDGRKFE